MNETIDKAEAGAKSRNPSLMTTKEQIQERAQLVRIHEANCAIEFPTPEEANFRIAIMKQLGRQFGLKEIRSATVAGPVGTTLPRPAHSPSRTR